MAQTPNPSHSPTPQRRLEGWIARARRVLAAVGLTEMGLSAAVGLLCGLAIAVVLVGWIPFSLELRLGLWATIGLSGFAGAGVIAWFRMRPLQDDLVVAARLEEAARRRGTSLEDSVRGAVGLRENAADERLGRSRDLADAHIARTVQRLEDSRAFSSLFAIGLQAAMSTLLVAFFAVIFFGGAVLLFPSAIEARIMRLFDDAAAEQAVLEQARTQLPIVTDLSLTLRYPAYMEREDATIPGASGDVKAPRGTEVRLEGRADRKVSAASLLLGEEEVALSVGPDQRALSGAFVVNAAGTYRFRLVESGGDVELDPIAHKIELAQDETPTVEVIGESIANEAPEASEGERVVQLDDAIDLVFRGKDDFGLTKFRVVVRRQDQAGEPWSEDVMTLAKPLSEIRGTARFTPKEAKARPGDRLSVYIEADDNDTVSGPKVGRSQTRVYKVFSAAEHHRALIDRQQELLDAMVGVLADELEFPIPGRDDKSVQKQKPAVQTLSNALGNANQMLAILDDITSKMRKDRLAKPAVRRALEHMRTDLAPPITSRAQLLRAATASLDKDRAVLPYAFRRIKRTRARLVDKLEKHILYLEDLLNQQRMDEAREIMDEMKRTQEDLKALIDEFKKEGDPKMRERILAEIQRMREQMAKLQKRLAELRREVPDEYLNAESMETSEMMDQAKSLDEMIEEGRLDDAAKALEQMLEQTQRMMDQLNKSKEEFGDDEYKELREKMERFSSELTALEQAQQDQARQNERMMQTAKREAQRRLANQMKEALDQAKKTAQEALDEMKAIDPSSLAPREEEDAAFAEARLEDVIKALEQGDLEEALKAAEGAEMAATEAERSLAQRTRGRFGSRVPKTLQAKDKMQSARPKIEDVRKTLDEAMPNLSEMLNEAQQRQLKKDAKEQRQLKERAESLQKQMGEISKEMPVFGPEHQRMLDEAGQQMDRAADRLGRQDMRGTRQAQQDALHRLGELKQSMQQMGEQGGQGGGGIPMPLPGGMPGGGQGGRQQEGNRGDSKQDRVKIPGADAFQVPDAFRKDILDAMREDAPKPWQGEVKKYYEELVK